MTDNHVSEERLREAQSEVDGQRVARMILNFQRQFAGVYPHRVLHSDLCAVGPLQSLLGLAIKDGLLALRSAASPVEVKGLEWGKEYSERPDGEGYVSVECMSIVGRYSAFRMRSQDATTLEFDGKELGRFNGLGEAKAAAQADYATRIRSALSASPVPASGVVATVLLTGEREGVMYAPGERFHGWLMHQHPDGQWISVRKLDQVDPFDNPVTAMLRAK